MDNSDNTIDISMTNYSRFVEVGIDEQYVTTNIMVDVTRNSSPLVGYAEEPLLPLSKACVPLINIINNLLDYVQLALDETPQEPPDGLTVDESAAIRLYTMQWGGLHQSLYSKLNHALKEADRDDLRPYFKYMKLFLTAVVKLPCIPSSTIWRGISKDLSAEYPPGAQITWWKFSSCTAELPVLKNKMYLGDTGNRTLLSIEAINGRSIRAHSNFQSEDEIILLPGTQMKVQSQLSPASELHIIHLKQVIPKEVLLEPPFEDAFLYPKTKLSWYRNTRFLIPICLLTILFIPAIIVSVVLGTRPNTEPPDSYPKWLQNGSTVAGGNGRGNGSSQLRGPYELYIDEDQTLYVLEYNNSRIVEWKSGATSGEIVVGSDEVGNRTDQLSYPTDMIIHKENNSVIICDADGKRVVRWSFRNGTDGEIIISNIDGSGLAMDNDGYLYVSDTSAHEVRRWKIGDKDGIIVAGGKGPGSQVNQLNWPTYIFVDQDHSVYVSDSNNHRVMKWMKDAKEGIVVAGGRGSGPDKSQLSYPRGIIVDQLGTVYVADANNNRVIRWLKGVTEGSVIVGGNGKGNLSNQLSWPMALSFDQQNNLYVADHNNNRVQKFNIEVNSNL